MSSLGGDRRQGGALAGLTLAGWVLGAGVLGGSWALHRVESSLEGTASELAVVVQARSQGASIDWEGRTANLSQGSLDTQQVDEVVSALAGLNGVAGVNVLDPDSQETTDATRLPAAGATTTESPTTELPTTESTTTTQTPAALTTEPPTTEAVSATTTTTTPANDSDPAVQLELLLAGRTVEFIFSTAVPTPETEVLLDELHDLLEANHDLSLHITGHTDLAGNETANQLLSVARAQSIANHLIIRGIDADRMTTAGKGSSEPIADNDTIVGKQQNRRVVIEAAVDATT